MCSPYFTFYPVQIALVVAFFFFFLNNPSDSGTRVRLMAAGGFGERMLCVSRRVTWFLGAASGVFDLFIRTSIWGQTGPHTARRTPSAERIGYREIENNFYLLSGCAMFPTSSCAHLTIMFSSSSSCHCHSSLFH